MKEIEDLRQAVRDAFSRESVSMLVEGHDIMRAIDAVEAAVQDKDRTERTCKNVHEHPRNCLSWASPRFKCSDCGKSCASTDYFDYCPFCGAKVVDG